MLSDEAAEAFRGTPWKAGVIQDRVCCPLTSILFPPLPVDAEAWQDRALSLDVRVPPAFEGSQVNISPLTQGCLVM